MNVKKIIIITMIVIFSIIAFYSMSDLLTPYISFKESMRTDNFVQIIGELDKSIPIEYMEGYFTFTLKDKDDTRMNFIHRGTKPFNFEHAKQIVVLGKYKQSKRIFESTKILIKCPSKYEQQKRN